LNSERIDPETLAAFLDGTLPADERERVLQALAQGGAAYDDLIEAQALWAGDEIGTAAPPPPVAPPQDPPLLTPRSTTKPGPTYEARRWRRGGVLTIGSFLAAASIAGVVLVKGSFGASRSPTSATLANLTATANGQDPTSLFGAGWDQVNWSITRGPSDLPDDRVRAFRLGVRFVDFAMAASSRNAESRRELGRMLSEIAAKAETGTAATGVAARVDSLTDSAQSPSGADLTALSDDLRTLVAQAAWYDAAVWSESARLAGRARRMAFFANDNVTRELRRIVSQMNADSPTADVIQSLRRVSEQHLTTDADLGAILPLLDSAIAQGGRIH